MKRAECSLQAMELGENSGESTIERRSPVRFRVLSPSGVPITFFDILAGIKGVFARKQSPERFRREIARYFSVKHVCFASSGRVALSMLLTALGKQRPERDEVVLPGYTSFSVPSAVVNAGFKVALYDLDRATLSPDPASLEKALNERTLCIVVCHLYGYPCDMDAVRELAARRGIPVIDDAAQAMGATYKGRYAGTLGAAGLFSLSRGKNISTIDGGIIVTDSDELAAHLSRTTLLRTGGVASLALLVKAVVLSVLLRPRFYWIPAGIPFLNLGASEFAPDFPLHRYTPFQAAIGTRMLGRLEKMTIKRALKAETLTRGIGEGGRQRLVQPVAGADPAYLRLPIFCHDNRWVTEPGLGVVKSYPAPLNEIEALKPYLVNDGPFPGAKYIAEHVVTLPTHDFVSGSDLKDIALFVKEQVTGLWRK